MPRSCFLIQVQFPCIEKPRQLRSTRVAATIQCISLDGEIASKPLDKKLSPGLQWNTWLLVWMISRIEQLSVVPNISKVPSFSLFRRHSDVDLECLLSNLTLSRTFQCNTCWLRAILCRRCCRDSWAQRDQHPSAHDACLSWTRNLHPKPLLELYQSCLPDGTSPRPSSPEHYSLRGSNAIPNRKCLFWRMFIVEKSLSLTFGRPPLLPGYLYMGCASTKPQIDGHFQSP